MSGGGECRLERGGWKTGSGQTKGCQSSAMVAPGHDLYIDARLEEESRVFKRATESSQ